MRCLVVAFVFFFCKQKTAYEMRISDWSSDVCSSDLTAGASSQCRCGHAPRVLPIRSGPICACRRRCATEDASPLIQAHPPQPQWSACNGECGQEIGRAACRERECQYVTISVVAVSLKKNNKIYRKKLISYLIN